MIIGAGIAGLLIISLLLETIFSSPKPDDKTHSGKKSVS
jgi:hypothetical protein